MTAGGSRDQLPFAMRSMIFTIMSIISRRFTTGVHPGEMAEWVMAENYDPERVRSNIRRLLEYRGRSSFEVSLAIGKSRTYIDDFLRGRKRGMAPSVLVPISRELNCSSIYTTGSYLLPDDLSKMVTSTAGADQWATRQKLIADAFGEEDSDGILAEDGFLTFRDQIPELISERGLYPFPENTDGQFRTYKKEKVSELWSAPLSFVKGVLETQYVYLDILKMPDESLDDLRGGGISKGDLVFINRDDTNITREGLFALMEGDTYTIKKVILIRGSDPISFDCVPLNPNFSSYRLVTSGEVKIIGRLVGQLRSF